MPIDPDEQIEEEALVWLMRSTSGDFDEHQQQALQQWLAQSESHRRAFADAQRLWQGLSELPSGESTAGDKRPNPRTNRPLQKHLTNPLLRHRSLAAACFVFSVALLLLLPDTLPLWLAEHRTAVGEQKALQLSDGSIIYLNSGSALNTVFDTSQRQIILVAGEAEFVVAKDRKRPFVVIADDQQIQALGTDFIVKKHEGDIEVTVIESRVQITDTAGEHPTPVVLGSGQRLINSGERVSEPEIISVDTEIAAAWRKNQLIFEAETLDKVIAEINRYRPGQVLLANPDLASYRVSGVFRIDQIDHILAVIDQTLPVRSVSLIDRYVWLF